ncbi:NAD(P)H-dependent oxidoreductase [Bacillus sp. FJAT-49736]|uniref:NADPH-dependent FMN reductase n=1 Tax=Bacillus sp. FJAT-49736 TaxID=2833582 RepID=UPI001BC9472C|nr:NAD(P)H-dependent oxidoreductase [Bacillus sp. FJAT-49736]MBS4174073.1 NAD(P)H-dependent oxidoreductase [Bacillus sp. FJAT-49736]
MKLLGISGSVSGRKTRIMVEKVLSSAKEQFQDITTELLDLKEYNVQFCDGRNPSDYTGDTKKVIEMVTAADAFIIGTPIYQASMTGALKNLFDLVPVSAFSGKVIGFLANGGTYQHYLVIENQLKPIAGFFRSYVAPNYVYAHDEHFNQHYEIIDQNVLNRIDTLAKQVVTMQKSFEKMVF